MNKKAITWEQLVLAIIAVVVVVLVIIWFKGGGEKAFGVFGEKVGELGDCDKDKVADVFDKCPCYSGISDTLPEGYSTCPSEYECTPQQKEYCKKCGELICP